MGFISNQHRGSLEQEHKKWADLVRCKCFGSNERRWSQDNDGKHVLDHRREESAHDIGTRVDETKEERKAPAEASKCLSHLLSDTRLLGELTLEEDTVWLGQRRDDGLLARESLPQLGLPQLNLPLLRVLVREGCPWLLGG